MLPDSSEILPESRPLVLPFRGKTYSIPAPPAATGRRLLQMIAAGIMAADGEQLHPDAQSLLEADFKSADLATMCLSVPVYTQMVDDGLSQPELELAVSTAFMCWTVSHEFAEEFWCNGGKAPGLTSMSAPPPTATPTPEAAATSTPNSASPSGTKSPAKSKARGSRSRKSSPGTRSSSTSTSISTSASTPPTSS